MLQFLKYQCGMLGWISRGLDQEDSKSGTTHLYSLSSDNGSSYLY